MLGTARRVLAGGILIVVGLWFAGQPSTSSLRAVLGLVILMVWGGAGVAVVAGRPWGRFVGLTVVGLTLIVAASLALQHVDSPFAGLVFAYPDSARWYVVGPSGYVLATLSILAGLLVLLPFRPGPTGPDRPVA